MKNLIIIIYSIYFSNICFAQSSINSQNNNTTNSSNSNIQASDSAETKLQKLKPLIDDGTNQQNNNSSKTAESDNISSSNSNQIDTTEKFITDKYPVVGKIEVAVLGKDYPKKSIQDRLSELEKSVFRKEYPDLSLYDRTEKLKKAVLGDSTVADMPKIEIEDIAQIPISKKELSFLDEIIESKNNDVSFKTNEEKRVCIKELINQTRNYIGLSPLNESAIAQKLASDFTNYFTKQKPPNSNFETNPDIRYTRLGGRDMLVENIIEIKDFKLKHLNSKAGLAYVLKRMLKSEDIREALLANQATDFGFEVSRDSENKIYASIEIISNKGSFDEIPLEVKLGSKISVNGIIYKPYRFEKITLAWQDFSDVSESKSEKPQIQTYFPPLDYVAFVDKTPDNHELAINTIKTIGVIAAVAGGMFIPPVALAAPLIAMAGSNSTPKDNLKVQADIPIKSGVKITNDTFSAKIPVSNKNKPGYYYLSVWAVDDSENRSVCLSRRVIAATQDVKTDSKKLVKANESKQKLKNKSK